MNKIILSILTGILLFLSGCSGDSNGAVFGEAGQSIIEMELNTSYVVNEGDKFVPNEESTIIVEHTLDVSTKKITILSGSATLLRGDYSVN